MALEMSDIMVSVVVVIITTILFAINYSIYRRTKGGSYAFLFWAFGAGSYLIARVITLLGVVLTWSTNDLLTRGLGQGLFEGLAGFFVLLGMAFFGADLKVYKWRRETLMRMRVPFIVFTAAVFLGITFSGFLGMISRELAMSSTSSLSALFEVILWSIAAVIFYPLYKILKKGTSGWTLIYMGVLFVIIGNLTDVFLYIGYSAFEIPGIITSLLFASFLISGFFLLDRSMKG